MIRFLLQKHHSSVYVCHADKAIAERCPGTAGDHWVLDDPEQSLCEKTVVGTLVGIVYTHIHSYGGQ